MGFILHRKILFNYIDDQIINIIIYYYEIFSEKHFEEYDSLSLRNLHINYNLFYKKDEE